jgi:hypothetical protein
MYVVVDLQGWTTLEDRVDIIFLHVVNEMKRLV